MAAAFFPRGTTASAFIENSKEGSCRGGILQRCLPQARMLLLIAKTNDEDFSPDMRQRSINIAL